MPGSAESHLRRLERGISVDRLAEEPHRAAGCPAGLWPSRKQTPAGLSAADRTAHPTRQSRGIFAERKEMSS